MYGWIHPSKKQAKILFILSMHYFSDMFICCNELGKITHLVCFKKANISKAIFTPTVLLYVPVNVLLFHNIVHAQAFWVYRGSLFSSSFFLMKCWYRNTWLEHVIKMHHDQFLQHLHITVLIFSLSEAWCAVRHLKFSVHILLPERQEWGAQSSQSYEPDECFLISICCWTEWSATWSNCTWDCRLAISPIHVIQK